MGCMVKRHRIISHVDSTTESVNENLVIEPSFNSFQERVSRFTHKKQSSKSRTTFQSSSIQGKEWKELSIKSRRTFSKLKQQSWFQPEFYRKLSATNQLSKTRLEEEIKGNEFVKIEFKAGLLKYEQFIDIFVKEGTPCTIQFSGQWSTDFDKEVTDHLGHETKGPFNNGQLLLRLPGEDFIPINNSIFQFIPSKSGPLIASIFLRDLRDKPSGTIQAKFYGVKEKKYFSNFPELLKKPFEIAEEEKPINFLLFNFLNFLTSKTEKFINLFLKPRIKVDRQIGHIIEKLRFKEGNVFIFSPSLSKLADYCLNRKVKESFNESPQKFIESLPERMEEVKHEVYKFSYEVKGAFAIVLECLKAEGFIELLFSQRFNYIGISEANLKLDSALFAVALCAGVEGRMSVEDL